MSVEALALMLRLGLMAFTPAATLDVVAAVNTMMESSAGDVFSGETHKQLQATMSATVTGSEKRVHGETRFAANV